MTMTLEELRESLDVGCLPNTDRPSWFVAIDAAIRERDELRTAYTSASQSRDYWKECTERAEAEFAALKARIADGWLCGVSNDKCSGNFDAAIYCLPSRFRGKCVRLLVED